MKFLQTKLDQSRFEIRSYSDWQDAEVSGFAELKSFVQMIIAIRGEKSIHWGD
jgi:hypothetical protein